MDFLSLWHAYRTHAASLCLLAVLLVRVGLRLWHQARRRQRSRSPASVVEQHLPFSPHGAKEQLPGNEKLQKSIPRRIQGQKPISKSTRGSVPEALSPLQPLVFFSSLTGSTEKRAVQFGAALSETIEAFQLKDVPQILPAQLLDLSSVEYDDYFTSLPKSSKSTRYFYLILAPSYNIDTNLDNFLEQLQETHHDFRVDTTPLLGIAGYSVFGFGDREGWPTEADGFCSQAKRVDKWLAKFTGGKRAYPLGVGDVKTDAAQRLDEWRLGVETVLKEVTRSGFLGEGVSGSGDAVESDDEEDEEAVFEEDLSGRRDGKRSRQNPKSPADLEEIGGDLRATSKGHNQNFTVDLTVPRKKGIEAQSQPKEMVPRSSPTYAALTKQGYTIVGSHSGVKICRWTKSALRGRGSCYKYSFYGINSHLCMETTPSLSCSNKCVFCWRHGTNPVGTSWRWQVDPPEQIFEGVKQGHYTKIKMLRGVPGVRAERFEEAMRIRHCALSLVGEPIFYPHINAFTALLHGERISSFLVCNAQHPDQLAELKPVTQLYVSIDASNRESLRRIDRPLHRDFWERFCRCLDILRERRFRQRTVFRLTLVKGFNIEDEAEGYADLVARGMPCFVEIKGVTYCGTATSSAAGLTMRNVPFYEEIKAFAEALDAALAKRGLEYGIAAEHVHSCCVLLASRRFWIEGRWYSVIDYEKFFVLLESEREFRPEEYVRPTEDWALWGKGGFDPRDERVKPKGKNKTVAVKPVDPLNELEVEIK